MTLDLTKLNKEQKEAALKARIEKCTKTPDSNCTGGGTSSGSFSTGSKPATSVGVGEKTGTSFSTGTNPASSAGTGAIPGTSFKAGAAVNTCNTTDKNGAKLTGAKCAGDGKCYYAARGQACGTYSIYCQATANKPLYQCLGNVLKLLVVTADGLNCDYLKTVQTCAANQKCGVVNGGTSGSCQ